MIFMIAIVQDAVFSHPTKNQAARGGNIIYSMLQFRRLEQREELKPVSVQCRCN
jgi:hypothetical protein